MNKIKFSLAIIGIVSFVALITISGYVANATVYPSYNNQSDCRGCHGSDVSNRHHMLVVNGTFQCTDCHPIIYDNVTQSYYPQVVRDCLVCHPGKNHTQVHHYFVQQGLFECSDCHPVVYDNASQGYSVQVTFDCPVCHSTVLSIQNNTNNSNITNPPPTNTTGPSITNYSPIPPVVSVVGDNESFEIVTDQLVNVTWTINDSKVQADNNVANSTYINTTPVLGTWNVSAVASNDNGTVMFNWSWNVVSVIITPPSITGYVPMNSTVTDYAGISRKFGVATDQVTDISWYLNGNLVQSDNNVAAGGGSTFINSSTPPGTYNVIANVTNSNGSVNHMWTWNVLPPVPYVISFDPSLSLISDMAGNLRNFSIGINQTANISWYMNGSLVQSNNNVLSSSYSNNSAIPGTYIINATALNSYGSDSHSWTWNILPPIPYITSFDPIATIINDTTGASRNFSVGINQTVNVSWFINGSLTQSNNNVTSSSLNITSIPNTYLGVSNVSAIASNNYGSDRHSWTWNVTRNAKTPTGSHSNVNCSTCHSGSYSQKPQEGTCYTCHNNSANSANKTNIYLQFTMSNDTYAGMGTPGNYKGYYPFVNTRHDITDADQNYSSTKLECTDCHSGHNASRTSVLIDPDTGASFIKTMTHPGTQQIIPDYITYCLKCHDNSWSPNVTGPSIITNISYWYLVNMSKGDWHGNAYGDKNNNTYLIGPYASQKGKNNVPAMPCSDCHDSHGSGGLYHLKTLTDQYGVNITLNSGNINTSDVAHWCSHCHKDPMQVPTNQQNKGNCLRSQCHAHGNRF